MTSGEIRVRFAPSPTGLLHVGNARTALYNWLFARRHGGAFVLRIEDTDMERSETRYETQIMQDLRWLGLDWDEGPTENVGLEKGAFGPYRQSERLEIYVQHTERLLAEEKAYRCYCTPEELEAERQQAIAEECPQVYSGKCRNLSATRIYQNLVANKPYAVRLRIGDQPIRFHDLVRGEVEFAAESVSDPVIVRSSNGGAAAKSADIPVYNYVAAVDDALMGITHVIRGDDHISNTPRQVPIYQAFGWKVPQFAHLSTILGADRERLSKRHGATSISTFHEMGYLPEALFNYLALLGWGAEDGKTETFTRDELTRVFSLERVTPSPAVFDFEKLNWLNRHYIKQTKAEDIAEQAWEYYGGFMPPRNSSSDLVRRWFAHLVGLFAPSVNRLDALPAKTSFMFGFDPEGARKNEENIAILTADSSRIVLSELASRVRAHPGLVAPSEFSTWLNEIKAATGIKGKDLFHPIRIALTGSHSGPDLDKLIPLIEEGAHLRLDVPSVRQRIENFVGV
jgi:nondiscriminating glutamyl-tRNA synthetase